MDVGSAVLILEKNCSFKPLRQKLGRLKRDCKDMGTLIAALVKYVDSDNTKDPESGGEKTGKGKRNDSRKGQQHNPENQNSNKHKADDSPEFVANTNTQDNGQRRKGKPPPWSGGSGPNLERLLNQP